MSENPSQGDGDGSVANPYASASRWKHQESDRYYEREGAMRQQRLANPDNTGEQTQTQPDVQAGAASNKEIVCGPLLNYRGMIGNKWIGSVLCVTKGGGKAMAERQHEASLHVRRVNFEPKYNVAGMEQVVPPLVTSHQNTNQQTGGPDNTTDSAGPHNVPALPQNNPAVGAGWNTAMTEGRAQATILYSDPRYTFWQFDLEIEIDPKVESKWEYVIEGLMFPISATKPQRNCFFIPPIQESMRILFFSCNGFSVGTDEEAWSGPALWNDVMRQHNSDTPFHVMLGGGDQIYNDAIRVSGPLREWADMGNPQKRKKHPYPESLRRECDDWYLKNYLRWFNTDPFATANGQIPQMNIWDDHDIIDGFGSYVHEFMMCDVFRGIGGTAHKYYMLFQHHLAPPVSTFVTGESLTTNVQVTGGQGVFEKQLADCYVAPKKIPACYMIGTKPGPYVAEHSHHLFARLGARIAFAALDARTERTRHQINYPETYDQMFNRLDTELAAAASMQLPYKHLILMLGIPIAYPRLAWLENILSSPVIGAFKFLNKRFGVGGGAFNKFDGNADLLDDLDDHYTARTHKKERNAFIERLQGFAQRHSIRVTILGGDVHLAALGRFYTKPTLKVPVQQDARYMVNVVSSAIVNKPPPHAVANLLAKRNIIHHLNDETDERLLNLFNKDPGNSTKTRASNHCTMPSRNFAMITENSPHNPPRAGVPIAQNTAKKDPLIKGGIEAIGIDGESPLHEGELMCGTEHPAATRQHGRGNDGSLDICFRVEIDQKDRAGTTQGYGLTVPTLVLTPQQQQQPLLEKTLLTHSHRVSAKPSIHGSLHQTHNPAKRDVTTPQNAAPQLQQNVTVAQQPGMAAQQIPVQQSLDQQQVVTQQPPAINTAPQAVSTLVSAQQAPASYPAPQQHAVSQQALPSHPDMTVQGVPQQMAPQQVIPGQAYPQHNIS